MTEQDIVWPLVFTQLAGGTALLLLGVSEVSRALKALSGTRLANVLQGLSGNRFRGALTGAVATALVQSSSVTTVLTVSFVSAGLMTLTQASSVVIGANLGTTVTAQIVALDITEYSLGIIAIGGLMLALGKRDRWRQGGQATIGLGMVFLGLAAMSSAMAPLADFEPFTNAMAATANPLLAALIGAVVAATIQSSSATTGIVVAMSAAGLIGLPTGIALVLGANIGTCVTAVISAVGRGTAAMQTAVVHVLVNLIGALVWLVGLDVLVAMVRTISGAEPNSTIATPQELANAHTIFNAINTVVFLTALPALVWLATRLVPDRGGPATGARGLSVSDPIPSLLPHLHATLADLADEVRAHLARGLPSALHGSAADVAQVRDQRRQVRDLHRDIVKACAALADEELGVDQRDAVDLVLAWANALELTSAATSTGVVRVGRRRLKRGAQFSERTQGVLAGIGEVLLTEFDRRVAPLYGSAITPAASQAISSEDSDDGATESADYDLAYRHLAERLMTGTDATTYALEVEILAGLENIDALLRRFPSGEQSATTDSAASTA